MKPKQVQDSNQSRLDFFPITAFAAILGLGGFTVLLDKWHHLQWLPSWPYLSMVWIVSTLFFITSSLYIRKTIKALPLASEDYHHKIRSNFVAAISISLLILSIAYMGCCPFAALFMWYLGTISHTIIMFNVVKQWVNHEFDIAHFNPAWFIPVVGLVLIPVAGVDYVPTGVVLFYWASGVVFWLIFFTIALYRIIFHPPLPAKLTPTLFMLMAPPAVIFISYIRITMHFDITAKIFLSIAIFMAVLLIFVKRQYSKIGFFMSWWAFTFPIDALAIAFTLAYIITRNPFFKYSSWVISLIATIVITLVGFHTISGIISKKICVRED